MKKIINLLSLPMDLFFSLIELSVKHRHLSSFIVLSLFISSAVGIGVFFKPKPIPYDFKKSIVKVIGSGHGSGSIIDTNLASSLILTNAHVCNGVTFTKKEGVKYHSYRQRVMACAFIGDRECVDKYIKMSHDMLRSQMSLGRTVNIKFNNLKIPDVKGVIKHISPDSDLCLVSINIGQLPLIKISKSRAKVGDRVRTINNSSYMTNHMTEGFIGDDSDYLGNKYQHLTAIFYGGASGSPTVNTSDEVVGVNTLGTDIVTEGYMIPLEEILMFLSGKMLNRVINMEMIGDL